jgi:hypothetical protein
MESVYRFLRLAVVAGLSVFIFHTLSRAQLQVTLNTHKDNTLYESATGAISNGAGQSFFVGRSGQLTGSIRRGLVAFPIAESIPQGSTVNSVTLTLHMSRTGFAAPTTTIEMHRALADWGEGSANADGNEGSGAPASTNDATWIHRFFDTATWTHPGSDFEMQSSASQTVAGVGFYTWESTNQLVRAVQQWLDDPASNSGWVMIGNEENSSTSKRFDTKENIDQSFRPRLTIIYQPIAASVDQQSITPTSRTLLQNYPNPFNPVTVVSYQLPEAGSVRLVVYDLLGREVSVLVNEKKEPGNYTVAWNASRMASGVYLYRMQSGNLVQTRKMILTK